VTFAACVRASTLLAVAMSRSAPGPDSTRFSSVAQNFNDAGATNVAEPSSGNDQPTSNVVRKGTRADCA
jgi:hypothetical protein